MLYQLKQGKTEENIIEQCRRLKRPLPKAIAEAPDLLPGLELYYRAFCDLNTTRQIGMSLGPIPFNEMWDYAVRYELSEEQREDLFYHVSQMDTAYLAYNESKMEQSRQATKREKGKRFLGKKHG